MLNLLLSLVRAYFFTIQLSTLPEQISSERVAELVQLALQNETAEVPAEALLSLAYRESFGHSDAVSFLRPDGMRYKWRWASRKRPIYVLSGGLYCGVFQTQHTTWEDCLAQRDDRINVRILLAEFSTWLRACRAKYQVERLKLYVCAYSGYTGGWALTPTSRVGFYAYALQRQIAKKEVLHDQR